MYWMWKLQITTKSSTTSAFPTPMSADHTGLTKNEHTKLASAAECPIHILLVFHRAPRAHTRRIGSFRTFRGPAIADINGQTL